MKTIILWYRNDLRVHDHPALATAVAEQAHIVPLFILDKDLLKGNSASANRNRFLLESLADLKNSLLVIDADLIIRSGKATEVLRELADELHADVIYYTKDYTPYAIKRDKELSTLNIPSKSFPGRLITDDFTDIHTKAGTTHKIFTPFYKNWLNIQRRNIALLPKKINFISDIKSEPVPLLDELCNQNSLSLNAIKGGETEARKKLFTFLDIDIFEYAENHNDLAADKTSRISSYLHFGCLSVAEIESLLPDSPQAEAWRRQLAWRDFYNYVLFHYPENKQHEFQEKLRNIVWNQDQRLFDAWKNGLTGYPLVDAAMRQLKQEGWMHNRARLIVGSFLTKDLWIDWRMGEAYFMHMLIDGDSANNNGNWQWIASIGVDPAPAFRRLYNPTSQLHTYDPSGTYTHRYLPELKNVPLEHIAEPWKMPIELQQKYNCVIGKDYPAPIVDHAIARVQALQNFRDAKNV